MERRRRDLVFGIGQRRAGGDVAGLGAVVDGDHPPLSLQLPHALVAELRRCGEWLVRRADHDYPSYLELVMTATDASGLSSTASVQLYPNTVDLSFASTPQSGLTLAVGTQTAVTPFTATVIVGSTLAVNAPSPQGVNGPVTSSWDGRTAARRRTPSSHRRAHRRMSRSSRRLRAAYVAMASSTSANSAMMPTRPTETAARRAVRSNQALLQPDAAWKHHRAGDNPTGGGIPNIEIIRDGDKPPVGTNDTWREYNTYHDYNPATAGEDWIGYAYPVAQTFSRVVFQEGMHFVDGGWFTTLTVQVRQNGAWAPVSGPTITPAYPGITWRALRA